MKVIFYLLLLVTLALTNGCATVKILKPTGGSRADGIVELSFSYGLFEKPEVNWEQGKIAANHRCKGWGYDRAERFSGGESRCASYTNSGTCAQHIFTIKYQCINENISKPTKNITPMPDYLTPYK